LFQHPHTLETIHRSLDLQTAQAETWSANDSPRRPGPVYQIQPEAFLAFARQQGRLRQLDRTHRGAALLSGGLLAGQAMVQGGPVPATLCAVLVVAAAWWQLPQHRGAQEAERFQMLPEGEFDGNKRAVGVLLTGFAVLCSGWWLWEQFGVAGLLTLLPVLLTTMTVLVRRDEVNAPFSAASGLPRRTVLTPQGSPTVPPAALPQPESAAFPLPASLRPYARKLELLAERAQKRWDAGDTSVGTWETHAAWHAVWPQTWQSLCRAVPGDAQRHQEAELVLKRLITQATGAERAALPALSGDDRD
jgi:hypothetical protein